MTNSFSVCAAIGMIGLCLAGCATKSREGVQGDGAVVAPTGAHAFEVQFDPISISEPGEYVFRFENAPPIDMHTLLNVESPGPDIADQLDKAGVSVRMELVGTASSADLGSYHLRDGLLEGEWLRTTQSYNAEPLEYVGMWFKPRRHEFFEMRLHVRVLHPERFRGLSIAAVPSVRGGSMPRRVPAQHTSDSGLANSPTFDDR